MSRKIYKRDVKRAFKQWLSYHKLDPRHYHLDYYRSASQRMYQVQCGEQSLMPLGSNWHTGAEIYQILTAMTYYQIFKIRGF